MDRDWRAEGTLPRSGFLEQGVAPEHARLSAFQRLLRRLRFGSFKVYLRRAACPVNVVVIR